jgi:WD40 repeat protein
LATGGGELDCEARIWDAKTYQQRARLIGGHQHALLTLAYCQNGQRVLTGSAGGADPAGQREGALRCWDVKPGNEVADFSDCR